MLNIGMNDARFVELSDRIGAEAAAPGAPGPDRRCWGKRAAAAPDRPAARPGRQPRMRRVKLGSLSCLRRSTSITSR